MRKAHSRAVKLSAAFLARQSGVEAAAAAFGIDPRTLRGWVEAGDVPEDQWTAIRDVLQARGAEMAAKGDTRGLVAILTAAGIADRNVRYSTLIERREARRAADQEQAQPQPNLVHEAVHALSGARQRYMRDTLHLEISERGAADDPTLNAGLNAGADPSLSDEEGDARLLAWIAAVAAMTDEQIAAGSEAARARMREIEQARDGTPALPVAIIEDGTPEGTRARLALDVSPGAVPPQPEPEIGRDGVWRESPVNLPEQWEAWRRFEP